METLPISSAAGFKTFMLAALICCGAAVQGVDVIVAVVDVEDDGDELDFLCVC